MATRISSPVHRRTSLPLTESNENDLSALLESSSYQLALEKLTGTKIVDQEISSSALLHAIFEAGMATIKKTAELEGYAQIASAASATNVQQKRKEARRRRPTWAGEE